MYVLRFGKLAMDENEIWDINDVSQFLKMSVPQVRELCRTRSQARMEVPLPFIKIHNKCVRFRRSDVVQWVNSLAVSSGAQQ